MALVPESFLARTRELFGQKGEAWMEGLPDLLERCASRFGVTLEATFANLSYNLLLKATRQDGTPAVVKLGVDKEDLFQESSVLRAYAGRGTIGILDEAEELGALLLERVEPGTPLSKVEEDSVATETFCDVFLRMHGAGVTFADRYPTLENHFAAIGRYRQHWQEQRQVGPLPNYWVERASENLAYLFATTETNVLLHGDLHHENILKQNDHKWVVIDPKGYVGDLHFEVIQFLLNYEDRGGDPFDMLQRRIGILSERLGLNSERIAKWGVARGVLEACWALEGGSDWQRGVQITERFAKLLEVQ